MNPILQQMQNSNNGNDFFAQMMQSNPQFRKFVEENKGLSYPQIADKYGINIDNIRKLLK